MSTHPEGWSPCVLGDPFPHKKIRSSGAIIVVIVFWAMRVDQLQPWHEPLNALMHATVMTMSAHLAIDAFLQGRRALAKLWNAVRVISRWLVKAPGRSWSWLVRHVKVERGALTLTLGTS